jgi:hypothetical protein
MQNYTYHVVWKDCGMINIYVFFLFFVFLPTQVVEISAEKLTNLFLTGVLLIKE